MCQLLESAGFSVADDGKRQADDHNPYGYYEVGSLSKELKNNPHYLDTLDVDAVKVVAHYLNMVKSQVRCIYMLRPIADVVASMDRMCQNEQSAVRAVRRINNLCVAYASREFETIFVRFNKLVYDLDANEIVRINKFIGATIDPSVIHTRH
jgi:hypothetical protein